jgi:malonyl-CoA O-methyltransferase
MNVEPPRALRAAGLTAYDLDKARLRRHTLRATPHYDAAAWLPRQVAAALMEHLQPVRMQPTRILDVGAGTGICSRLLSRQYASARLIALDCSPSMLALGRSPWPRWIRKRVSVCADAQHLPLEDRSIDLLVSSLMLQSCAQPERMLAEFHRVLAPGGLLMLASLGPDTLWQLRESWKAVDAHVHVHAFIDMHDLGDALQRAGFQDVVMDTERFTRHYQDVRALASELQALGSANAAHGCHKGLTTPARFARMAAAYEAFRNGNGVPASYEVVFGHAWRAPAHTVTFSSHPPPPPGTHPA